MLFWEWLRDYANKKVKENYIKNYFHDRKCERCGTCLSEVGGCAGINDDSKYPMFERMECKKCHHVSIWDTRLMIPVLVPNPYKNYTSPIDIKQMLKDEQINKKEE